MQHLNYVTPFLRWAHDSWLGYETRRLSWLFTTCLVLHFIGLSLLMGSMLIVDLRLLGFARRLLPIAAAMKFLPIAVTGFVINLCTGITMFTFDPFNYWLNPAFRVKMTVVLLAGLNALWFMLFEQRRVLYHQRPTTIPVRISAALSLFLWFTVMIWGRMIVAFQGSSDLFVK